MLSIGWIGVSYLLLLIDLNLFHFFRSIRFVAVGFREFSRLLAWIPFWIFVKITVTRKSRVLQALSCMFMYLLLCIVTYVPTYISR